MFVGITRKSPKEDLQKFQEASEMMLRANMPETEYLRHEVRKATGVYSLFGKDKLEISDKDSSIRKDLSYLNSKLHKPDISLKTLLKHKELYKRYPEFKSIPVRLTYDPNDSALGSAGSNLVNINLAKLESTEQLRSVLLHEIQHLIQDKHNWDLGSNIEMNVSRNDHDENVSSILSFPYGEREKNAIFKNYERLTKDNPNISRYDLFRKGVPEDCAEFLSKLHTYLSRNEHTGFKIYHRHVGEIEARSTQARIDMDMDERLSTHPYASESPDFESMNPVYHRWHEGRQINVRQNTIDELYEGFLTYTNLKESQLEVRESMGPTVAGNHIQEDEDDMYTTLAHNIHSEPPRQEPLKPSIARNRDYEYGM
ncbi:hypothetical protein [Vibrio harveyi]|uniref:hypothetical protein n=1 Tax=Vibrio harveyi TaxID=669 RepID=UPI003CFB0572